MVKYDVLILCSGGLDSVVMTHALLEEGYKCRLLYGNYEKKASEAEIAVVKQLSLKFSLPVEFVNLKGVADLQSGYVSRIAGNQDELDVGVLSNPQDYTKASLLREDGLYITGIYSLLSLASYAAQVTDIDKIALGVTKEQLDLRPTLPKALNSLEDSIKLFNPEAGEFKILSPFIDKTKSEIVSLGASLGVSFENTSSCLNPIDKVPCGKCSQCLHRKEAFALAGIEDKTFYG